VTGISLEPTACFNLQVLRSGAAEVEVTPHGRCHQWFAGIFTGLPTEGETTIRVRMAGHDIGVNKANCAKWDGLHPLLTYADPTRYESYEGFQRDARGRWVSNDLFKHGKARFAGRGPTPDQQVIPPDLAHDFLSPDGNYWFPWRDMLHGEADPNTATFTLREHFARPRATVAMHLPYTMAYHEAFLTRLRAANYPGVSIDLLGHSAEGRPLYMVRVDDPAYPTPLHWRDTPSSPTVANARHDGEPAFPAGHSAPLASIDDPPEAEKPRVMLIIAREHGTEHAPSWVVQGVLRQLLADTPESWKLRERTTWLLLFIYDPDGAANSVFHALTDRFFPHKNHPVYGSVTPREVIAYVRYLRTFINSGRLMAAVTAFYGLECTEGETVLCPHVMTQERALLLDFNAYWFSRLRKLGIPTHAPREPWHEGHVPYRPHGWCWYWYGAFSPTFEINDRYPAYRLTPEALERLGGHYARTLVAFLDTPAGKRRVQETRLFLEHRAIERTMWFQTSMSGTPDDPTLFDMLSMGY